MSSETEQPRGVEPTPVFQDEQPLPEEELRFAGEKLFVDYKTALMRMPEVDEGLHRAFFDCGTRGGRDLRNEGQVTFFRGSFVYELRLNQAMTILGDPEETRQLSLAKYPPVTVTNPPEVLEEVRITLKDGRDSTETHIGYTHLFTSSEATHEAHHDQPQTVTRAEDFLDRLTKGV